MPGLPHSPMSPGTYGRPGRPGMNAPPTEGTISDDPELRPPRHRVREAPPNLSRAGRAYRCALGPERGLRRIGGRLWYREPLGRGAKEHWCMVRRLRAVGANAPTGGRAL